MTEKELKQKEYYQKNKEKILRKAKERYKEKQLECEPKKPNLRHNKTVYLYYNQEYLGKFNSIKDVAQKCGTPYETVRMAYKEGKPIKDGFFVSKRELSQYELENISVDTNVASIEGKTNKGCHIKPLFATNIDYQVLCKDKLVCHLERSRNARVDQLKDFIWKKLWTRWTTINPKVATLEKQFLKEITDSLR